jgi:hypothetical protein
MLELVKHYVRPCALAVLIGCAAVDVHGSDLLARAEFDLRCPARQLQLARLDGQQRQNGEEWQPQSSGAIVRGCGQHATYAWSGQEWKLTGSPIVDDPLNAD